MGEKKKKIGNWAHELNVFILWFSLGFLDSAQHLPITQTINTYKVFLKDAVQLLGATSLEATKFAEEVFHFEKRIAELTPNTEDIINPVKSIQILNVADLQRQSFSVCRAWFLNFPARKRNWERVVASLNWSCDPVHLI
jgi:hypothetical protein